jgi:hypothetical protein
MCVLISSTTLFQTFLILSRIHRDIVVNVHRSMYSTHCSYRILNRLRFSQQIFEKRPNIKFPENPSSKSRVVPCGRTDMPKLTFAFRKFASAPEKGCR